MPRAEPLSVCAGRGRARRAGAGDPLQRHRCLPRENLQNFPLETAVAKRHALEMNLIDAGRHVLTRRQASCV
jgi:hypothetical protein